jgi:hypothetical protein
MTAIVPHINLTDAVVENEVPVVEPTPVAPTPVVPVATPQVPVTTATAVAPAPTYTLEAIAKAGTALIDAGKMGELMALLARYGVETLTALPTDKYTEFATELRGLGAEI